MFLCRSRREVRDKIAEIEQSGELAGRIEEIAARSVGMTTPASKTSSPFFAGLGRRCSSSAAFTLFGARPCGP